MSLFSLLRKPAWEHRDASRRTAAVASDTHPDLLAKLPDLARNDPEASVRLAALRRIDDLSLLGDRMRQANTLVVRDGRVLWVGEGGDLSADTLKPFLKPGFDYDTHVKEKAAYDARTGELLALLVKGLPAASKANDEAKVAEILETLEKEPNLHPFLFQRLRDTKCGIAFGKGDIAGAVAEMQKLADKEPDNAATQSWVHKVIMSTEAMNKPGIKLAAEAAARVAQLKEGDMARAWWEASAEHRLALGDKAAALAALEEAEKQSDPYRRLQAMKSAK